MASPKGKLVTPVGFRGDGSIHAFELDNLDRLKVIIDAITAAIVVTQTNPASLLVGDHGWDGSAWQKLLVDSSSRLKVLIDSVTGTVPVSQADNNYLSPVGDVQTFTNLNLAAGNSTQTVFTVPAGQRFRVHVVAYQYTGTVAGVSLRPAIVRSATLYVMDSVTGITSGQFYTTYPQCIAEAGDNISIRVIGATLNDDLTANLLMSRIK